MKILISLLFVFVFSCNAYSYDFTTNAITTQNTARCISCHAERQPKLVEKWQSGVHASEGVGCYECHSTKRDDPSVKAGHYGFDVSLIVSPLKCAECHSEEYKSFSKSSHARAYDTIKDHPMASESPVIFETTCAACHGNKNQLEHGRPVDFKWPNHGIGRINPDGSRGNCGACHGHHNSSLEQARRASTCGRCHTGIAGGGAYEAWKQSSHNQPHNDSVDKSKSEFIVLLEKIDHPDCYVCHMAPNTYEKKSATHNLSERLSWKMGATKASLNANWPEKRLNMQGSCRACHGDTQILQYYSRLDEIVLELNKLASEALALHHDCEHTLEEIKTLAITGRLSAAMLGYEQLLSSINSLKKLINTGK